MNILFVTDFYLPHIGGVEKLFSTLAEQLIKQGNTVTYITWRHDKRLPKKELINGVSVIRISSPTRFLFSILGLHTLISNSRNADIIHTSTYSSALGAWMAGKITGKKTIVTVHEVWGSLWLKMPFLSGIGKICFQKFEKWLLSLSFDHYIAVSEFTKGKLIESDLSPQKITRIYNGIEYNLPQWNSQNQPFTFTFFGRAGASKGLDILLEASEQIIGHHPDVRFKFIISPQSRSVYHKVIYRIKEGKLNNSSSVFSQLPQPELVKELLSSSCIIIPSLCEGFGFTAVESSAMNIPIISSGMGSLNEVVSGKVITMEEYSSNSLVKAMEEALANRFVEIEKKRFLIDDFVREHESLYLSLV